MKNDTLLECGIENSATIITCVAGSGEADSSNPSLLLSRQEFHRKVIETQTRLRGYALFLCGSHPAAEELLQETTLHILLKIDQYRATGSFYGWARKSMLNLHLGNLERAACHGKVLQFGYTPHTFSDEASIASETPCGTEYLSAPDSESLYCAKELHGIISRLPRLQREVMTLRINGYRYHEIAHALGTTAGNVKNAIFQARANIRRQLGE